MKRPLKVILLLALTIMLSIDAQSQVNYNDDYLVTLENDTIFGIIYDGGEIRNSKYCSIKTVGNKKIEKYFANEIKSYCLVGYKKYTSEKILYKGEYKNLFLEVYLEGKVNLYYDRKNDNVAYYIEKEEGVLIPLEQIELKIQGSGLVAYDSYKYDMIMMDLYKETLRSVFSDCKKVQVQISNIDYSAEAILYITKAYINETCGGDCIYFERNLERRYR